MATVSVVVPTRNRRALLVKTLKSVLWQQDVELEVIVVDEASTDDTAHAVAGMKDSRISVLRHTTPLGPGAARNRGAAQARGGWLAFVDDDDVWAPTKLSRQLHAAQEAARHWVYAGAVVIDPAGEIVSRVPAPPVDDVLAALPRYNPIPGGGSNVVVRRELLHDAGGFDQRVAPCEDWALWLELARLAPPACVSAPLVGYRVHSGNASLDLERVERAVRLLERLHGASVDWGRIHRWLAELCLRNGRRGAAIDRFIRAVIRGQARGVAEDARAILRRRYQGHIRTPPQGGRSDPSWPKEADTWIRELHCGDCACGSLLNS